MTFISLLSPRGRGKEAIDHLKKLKPPKGITLQNIYVTLGRYDAVVLFDAANIDRAVKFAIELGNATDCTTETLAAVSLIHPKAFRVA